MSRVGKIARLPGPIREELNRRLQDGENGQDLLAWLNSSPEVKAVLAREFEDRKINDTNLSAWRRGGYSDWEGQQFALDEARRVAAECRESGETGENVLADNLAVWLTGRYILAATRLTQNGVDPGAWKILRAVCHDLVASRRGDHAAERQRIEHERLELQRQKNAGKRKEAELDSGPSPLPLMDGEMLKQLIMNGLHQGLIEPPGVNDFLM
jgi:hypothetical protein